MCLSLLGREAAEAVDALDAVEALACAAFYLALIRTDSTQRCMAGCCTWVLYFEAEAGG